MIIHTVSRVVEPSMSKRSARGMMCLAAMIMIAVLARPAMAQDSSGTVIDMPPPPPPQAAEETPEVTVSQRPHLGRVALGQYAYGKRRPRNAWYNYPRRGTNDYYTQRWLIAPYGHRYGGYWDAYLWPGFWGGCNSYGAGSYSYRWSFGW